MIRRVWEGWELVIGWLRSRGARWEGGRPRRGVLSWLAIDRWVSRGKLRGLEGAAVVRPGWVSWRRYRRRRNRGHRFQLVHNLLQLRG